MEDCRGQESVSRGYNDFLPLIVYNLRHTGDFFRRRRRHLPRFIGTRHVKVTGNLGLFYLLLVDVSVRPVELSK